MTRADLIGIARAALISAVLFVIGAMIPLIGGIAMVFAPAPLLVYAAGRPGVLPRMGAAIAIAALLIGIAGGPSATIAYLATFGLATAIITLLLTRQRPFELVVMAAAGAMILAATSAALITIGGPAAISKAISTDLTSGMIHGQEAYRSIGITNAIPPETQSEILDWTVRLAPALAAIVAGIAILLNLRLFWRLGGKERLPYALFGDLAKWSAPEWLIWGLIATGFGMLAPVRAVSDVALNAFLVIAAIYFCQGLAIMRFYFQSLSVPGIVRGIIYFITVIQPIVAGVVCLAGIFDMWIDFRRLKPPSQEAGNFGDFL